MCGDNFIKDVLGYPQYSSVPQNLVRVPSFFFFNTSFKETSHFFLKIENSISFVKCGLIRC